MPESAAVSRRYHSPMSPSTAGGGGGAAGGELGAEDACDSGDSGGGAPAACGGVCPCEPACRHGRAAPGAVRRHRTCGIPNRIPVMPIFQASENELCNSLYKTAILVARAMTAAPHTCDRGEPGAEPAADPAAVLATAAARAGVAAAATAALGEPAGAGAAAAGLDRAANGSACACTGVSSTAQPSVLTHLHQMTAIPRTNSSCLDAAREAVKMLCQQEALFDREVVPFHTAAVATDDEGTAAGGAADAAPAAGDTDTPPMPDSSSSSGLLGFGRPLAPLLP